MGDATRTIASRDSSEILQSGHQAVRGREGAGISPPAPVMSGGTVGVLLALGGFGLTSFLFWLRRRVAPRTQVRSENANTLPVRRELPRS